MNGASANFPRTRPHVDRASSLQMTAEGAGKTHKFDRQQGCQVRGWALVSKQAEASTVKQTAHKIMIRAGLFMLGCMTMPAFAQTHPPAYPRPNATRIIDNDRVNIWDVYWMKNQPTPLHTHVIDQFSITLHGGLLRVSPAGGPWSEAHMSKIGTVNFVPAGTTHMEEGLSDIPQHKIMLEVKPSPPNPDIHGTSPGEGAVKLFENARLIAWDLTWKQGQAISRPREDLDSVTVFLDGGTIQSTGGDASTNIVRKSGQAVYAAHGMPAHVEKALGGTPHAIIVELK
jgi:hypothetical protein